MSKEKLKDILSTPTYCGQEQYLIAKITKYLNECNLDYKLKTPYNLFGVACGFEDTYWAEKTIGMVPLLVKELKKTEEITINNFLKYWEEKIKKK